MHNSNDQSQYSSSFHSHLHMDDTEPISDREKQVLDLISLEFTTKEIACLLNISAHTVNSHKKNLMSKFHTRNIAGLVRRGFELGVL